MDYYTLKCQIIKEFISKLFIGKVGTYYKLGSYKPFVF